MSKIVNRVAAIAALALAATPIVGLASAHAAERAEPVARIAVGDLTLSNPADAQEFARRVHRAGLRACQDEAGLRGMSLRACQMDFREDVRDAMTTRQVTDLALAKRAGAKVEMALR
ncbi:UrcA family protein [uncultured Caulobacter sp.]|uniref:UrcA family protein n=1 Tax=uncultured Caulobacter sp. TaxID=158749 RepID=UPI0026034C4F|nr:UrcA family protein [uncultured Caulobacter sp.]